MKAFLKRRRNAQCTGSRSENGARMILVERDVTDIGSVLMSTEGGSDVIVHVQQQDESPIVFAHAALHAITALERRGGALSRAIVVVGAETAAPTCAAREVATHALVTHLARSGGGELELVGPSGSYLGVREDLLLLVEDLLALSDGRVTLRVRFAPKAESSAQAQRAA
jgi:hypothetical protein